MAGLATGDYSAKHLEGELAIERKDTGDLIGSLTGGRDRFGRELQRMLAHRTRYLMVIGEGRDPREAIRQHAYRSKTPPQVIFASIASVEARGVPVRYFDHPTIAAAWIERLVWYSWRAAQRRAGLRPPAMPDWIRNSLLSAP